MRVYLDIANSNILFFICLIPVIWVLIQSVVFIHMGIKRCKEIGINDAAIKKVIANSAISSIVPSLPIIISMAALMPLLGKFVPWMRLSVIGSTLYEGSVAEIAAQALGFGGLSDTGITASAFVSIFFVMCVVSCVWPICNVVALRTYDSKLKGAQSKGGFIKFAAGALFIGLFSIMAVPRVLNFSSIPCIATCIAAGASALLLEYGAKKTKIRLLSDFSFPIAMVIGMAAAVAASSMAR